MTTLVDSSVWIEFLRRTGSPANLWLRSQLGTAELAVTEPVELAVLAGLHERNVAATELMLGSAVRLTVAPTQDFHAGAAIYRQVRRTGRTVRSVNDCLIAAIALRHGVPLAHFDADFDVIAEVTGLEVVRL